MSTCWHTICCRCLATARRMEGTGATKLGCPKCHAANAFDLNAPVNLNVWLMHALAQQKREDREEVGYASSTPESARSDGSDSSDKADSIVPADIFGVAIPE